MKLNSACRILLVEDDPEGCSLVQLLLQHHGHSVVSAGSMQMALIHIETHPFDFLICDIDLPDGSGWDLVRRMRLRRGSSMSAIALTWRSSPADVNESKIAGFDVHLAKPTCIDDLDACIHQLATRSKAATMEQRDDLDSFRESPKEPAQNRELGFMKPRLYYTAP